MMHKLVLFCAALLHINEVLFFLCVCVWSAHSNVCEMSTFVCTDRLRGLATATATAKAMPTTKFELAKQNKIMAPVRKETDS